MGYTMEGKKVVIWTQTLFIADDYPFQDDGENHTFFYSNLKDSKPFLSCLACISNEVKIKLVCDKLGLKDIVLRSKKSHYKEKYKSKK
jgi:hypothetical protein